MPPSRWSHSEPGEIRSDARAPARRSAANAQVETKLPTPRVWEAWVCFSYDEDGWRATRKDWIQIQMDQLTVLTIDDVPPDQVTQSATPSPSGATHEP